VDVYLKRMHGKVASLNSTRVPENIPVVPNQPRPGRKHRSVLLQEDDWEAGEAITKAMGTNRSAVIEQFLHWYFRKPEAELPQRPPAQVIEQAFTEWRERQEARDE
jgi:hypothetical protein